MLYVILLSVVMLDVIMLNVVILSVVAPILGHSNLNASYLTEVGSDLLAQSIYSFALDFVILRIHLSPISRHLS